MFRYIFSSKRKMQLRIDELEKEVDEHIKERDEEINKRKLIEKDNREIGNKVIVALEEIKELKRENKKLKKQLKEVK